MQSWAMHEQISRNVYLVSILCLVFFLGTRFTCIGLTGGIGAGKTLLSSTLAQYSNVHIIDADAIARKVLEPGTAVYAAIVAKFGESVLCASGERGGRAIDRAALRALISTHGAQGGKAARAWLNQHTHPRIFMRMMAEIAYHRWLLGRTVIVDAPLLFESGLLLQALCCPIVTVGAGPRAQLARVLARDKKANPNLDSEAVLEMMSAQMPLVDKAARSDVVLDNSGGSSLDVVVNRIHYLAVRVLGLRRQEGRDVQDTRRVACGRENCVDLARWIVAEDAVS